MTRSPLRIFLVAAVIGVAVAMLKQFPRNQAAPRPVEPIERTRASGPMTETDGGAPAPALPPATFVRPWLRAKQLIIPGADGAPLFQLAVGNEGPGLWMSDAARRGALQAGVHGNGFPFLLVSDHAVRNFGLGRVDGRNAAPILVFRSNDIVKMVFGLSMTEPGQPPVLVHWGADGKKHLAFGAYCDDPGRACTH